VTGTLVAAGVIAFRGVLLPFLLALVVAYVFAPIVTALERWMPRWVAVVTLYVALLGALAAFVAVGVPRLAVEVERLAREGPRLVRTFQKDVLPRVEAELRAAMRAYGQPEPAVEDEVADEGPRGFDGGVPLAPTTIEVRPSASGGYQVTLPPDGIEVHPQRDGSFVVGAPPREEPARRDVSLLLREGLSRQMANAEGEVLTVLRTLQSFARAVIRGIFLFFIMLMVSAYLLLTKDRIFDFLRSLVRPERHARFDDLVHRIDKGLSGVVRGQLLIALVNGVLSGIGFYLFDLQYWPILTLIATVLSVIPIFGAILSSVPAVIIALQDGFATAVFVLAWIIAIHQLEANVLNPKIMGDAAKVNPVMVIFALLAGEHLFGLIGVLLAVPVLSITQSLFLHFREIALDVPAPRTTIPP
jgi:predicted PurR-regulated permease PerM